MLHQEELDLSTLEILTSGDKDLLNEMIRLFLEQTPEKLNNLEQASLETDHKQVQSISHNLKSSFSLMGFQKLELITNLEQMAKGLEEKEKIYQNFLLLKKETNGFIRKLKERYSTLAV